MQPATASQLQNDIISALSHLIDLINNGNQSTTPNSGSSTLPDIDVPHVFQPNGGNNPGPFTFNFSVPGLTAPNLHHGGPPPDHDANPDVTAVLQ